MPSLEKRNPKVCSLHFEISDFEVFDPVRRRLYPYAVPQPELTNWSIHNVPLPSKRSAPCFSPLGESVLSPFSPHLNKEALRRGYGSKSRRELFKSKNLPLVKDNPDPVTEDISDDTVTLDNCTVPVVPESPTPDYSTNQVTPEDGIDLTSPEKSTHKLHDLYGEVSSSACSFGGKRPISDVSSSTRPSPSKRSDTSFNKTLLKSLSSPGGNIFSVTENSAPGGAQSRKAKAKDGARVHRLREKLAVKNRTINRLRMQVARSKKLKSSSLTKQEIVAAAKPFLKPAMQILLDAQLKLSSCKKKGMRWSKEMKDFTLGLMFHGPRCYRYLSKLIPLPSISTINRYQSVIPLKPGIHEHVKICLLESVKTWPQNKKFCTLVIDELSIQRHLEYDSKRDFVNGFVDDGTTRLKEPANLGVVASFKGILTPWKQIAGHWLTKDKNPEDVIYKAVLDCIDLANEAGLIVKLVVSDQGAKNRKMCRKLGVTPEKPYFLNGEEKVYFIWDPPHLIKSIRNNLLKRDFKWKGQVVSWKHIKALFIAQQKLRLKLTPKLTRRHVIFRSSFAKMKVKLATQVFSNSVNTGLLTFVAFNRLPSAAVHTATLCKDMNDLFDCFNSTQIKKDKFSLRYAMRHDSEHVPFLNPKMIKYFQESEFIGAKRQPYCLDGWILTIRALLLLIEDLCKNYGVKFVRTRFLNQDVLENLFSILRQQHGCNDNPTPRQLERGLRMVTLSTLMKLSNSSNCEQEMERAAFSLQKLPASLTVKDKEKEKEVISTDDFLLDVDVNAPLFDVEENALYYCCGFLTRQFLRKHKCYICEFKLLVEPDERMLTENYQMFIYFKAHSSKLGSDFGNLKAPSHESFATLRQIDNVFHQVFTDRAHERHIGTKIRMTIDEAELRLNLCSEDAEDEFLKMYVRTRISWEVRFMNRRFEDERLERMHQRKLRKLQPKENAAESKKKKEKLMNQNQNEWTVKESEPSTSNKAS